MMTMNTSHRTKKRVKMRMKKLWRKTRMILSAISEMSTLTQVDLEPELLP